MEEEGEKSGLVVVLVLEKASEESRRAEEELPRPGQATRMEPAELKRGVEEAAAMMMGAGNGDDALAGKGACRGEELDWGEKHDNNCVEKRV